jgi:hypothetical protein
MHFQIKSNWNHTLKQVITNSFKIILKIYIIFLIYLIYTHPTRNQILYLTEFFNHDNRSTF